LFAEARRAPHQNPPPVQAGPATVVILPVIRIEREGPGSPGENSNPPSPRKRRRRATRT
jgi:hypothetical protein